jgi:manganese/iron transport system permease protein
VTELLTGWADAFRLPFMQRAVLELLVLSVVVGVAGAHVVLRRLAFVSDTLTHTVFPGVVVAFLLGQSVLLGAAAAGILSAVLLGLLASARRVSQDAVLAVLLTSFFAVGVVLVSRTSGYAANLSLFLFGDLLAVTAEQVAETAVIAAGVLAAFAALHKELLFTAFDREAARAQGYRVLLLDVVLNVLLALVVVAAVRAVGTVLVIALLVVPAVTAQLVSDRVGRMMATAVAVAITGGVLGLLLSFQASVVHGLRVPAGASVVVTVVLLFGLVATGTALRRRLRARRQARAAPDGAA